MAELVMIVKDKECTLQSVFVTFEARPGNCVFEIYSGRGTPLLVSGAKRAKCDAATLLLMRRSSLLLWLMFGLGCEGFGFTAEFATYAGAGAVSIIYCLLAAQRRETNKKGGMST